MRSVCLVLLCGCGSVADKQIDAAVHHDSGIDVEFDGPAPPACQLTAPFGTPVNVGGVNTNSTDEWGWITPDGLTIYLTSAATSSSNLDIYTGTRAQASGNFSSVMLLNGPNTTNFGEERPVLSADGLSLYVHSNASGSGHIYVATRTSTAADFGTLALVTGINDLTTGIVDADPWLSADGLTMYFTSTRGGSANYDLYKATRANTTTTFATPVAIGELNGANVDDAPVVSNDGLEIFFASNRSSTSGGRNDIWHATRSSPTDGFGTATKVTELSADTTEDFPTWISADRCSILFSSDRATGSNGGYDIWMASRPQ